MDKRYRIWIALGVGILTLIIGLFVFYPQTIAIKNIQLTSPHNYAFQEEINVELDKPASIYIRYWQKGSLNKFRTQKTKISTNHKVNLLLLETGATYEYQIVIDRFVNSKSKILSFKTRAQSPWLDFNWVQENKPHDAKAFGDGLIMLCYARMPGYIALVNAKGDICWHWQVDDIGVRAATLTPRGTILAMLRPPKKDVIDDKPKEHAKILEEIQKPMRRGKLGFAGGTALVEIDMTGEILWRLDLDKEDDYKIIHHDIRMDENNNIHTLYRSTLPYEMTEINGTGLDTLGGDGILVMDTTGKEIWNWSVWDHWDIENDSLMKEFAYDRFHMNALNFDTDGNYLASVAIEDQIWKINSKTGELMWKFGKNGDFKMDTDSYFSFQHAININPEGDYMLFDNNLFREESRALSFSLDTITMTATTEINAPLPSGKYTSRMGNAYLLENGNILQTSSKTGSVLITNREGDILWELDSPFVPYRAEYIPASVWDQYFMKE
ncbi:aryl-sulfate sulfotransferase [Prolixibacteraceae bacterium Z1-6]|uniref:Aryl-sulfate sulfotransferase n=1 Tax=Draconibacterium aestuarii TaxID=2998507 RepID=A0A9X3FFK3_9BACT|nr:aryl-sulfate sulfotransferase [Prolixibacteraceae bacterium Z1-6]